jgi:hypothetical protein
MPWVDEDSPFDLPLPWDEVAAAPPVENTLDMATLLHHFNLLSLPTPASIAPCHIPLLIALIELRQKDERTITTLRADLRTRETEIRDLQRKHRSELRTLAPATVALEAVKTENSRLREKLLAAQKHEQKILVQFASSEKLVEHYQGVLRRRDIVKTPVVAETVDELIEAETPVIEESRPFQTLIRDESVPEPEADDEELTELEIYKGLVEGGE